MSNLCLELDSISNDLIGACKEAVAISNKLEISVLFMFQGIQCMARPGDNPISITNDWSEIVAMGQSKYRMAVDRDRI